MRCDCHVNIPFICQLIKVSYENPFLPFSYIFSYLNITYLPSQMELGLYSHLHLSYPVFFQVFSNYADQEEGIFIMNIEGHVTIEGEPV